MTSDVTPEAPTPGQAARDAFGEIGADWYPGTPWNGLHEDLRAQWEAAAEAVAAPLRAEIAGYQASCDGWRDENSRLEEELDAIRAERDEWQEGAEGWEGNFHAARKDADRYRAALEAAHGALSSIALGSAGDPSVAADHAAVKARAALEATP